MKKDFTKQDFYDLLRPNGDCLEWTKATFSDGYGQTWVLGRNMVRTHRLALELEGIDVPDDKFVLHSCDNRLCCNPAHLSIGNHSENMRDMASKGRHNGKLNPSNASEIRRLHSLGWSHKELAEMYDVTKQTIGQIINKHTWNSY